MQIQLVDLKKQYPGIKEEINGAIQKVLEKGSFILGENVKSFENEMAKFCGAGYAVGVASGTDALELSLMALGIGKNDEVITTPFTFIATSEAICRVGAKPVFADINIESYNIDCEEIKRRITKKTKAVIPVHLYGLSCDMDELMKLASKYNLKIIEDCCQAIGSKYKDRRVGSFGDMGCFSFFPSKNLSTYGDGGMIVTNDSNACELLKMLRVHGSRNKYFHLYQGLNSRLDEIHAAVLRVKLPHIEGWNEKRRETACLYNDYFTKAGLSRKIVLPSKNNDINHVYNIYAVRVENRDGLKEYLQKNGIQTGVHYPMGLHVQEVYKNLGYRKGDFPNTEQVASEIISLPMYPELEEAEIAYTVDTIKRFYKNG